MLKKEPIYCPRCGKLLAVKLPDNMILVRYNDSRATLISSIIEGKLEFVCASKRYRNDSGCGERVTLHFAEGNLDGGTVTIEQKKAEFPCGIEN